MHPKSKDRSGNAKLLADVAKQQGLPKPGPEGDGLRRSKYGARLAALRAKSNKNGKASPSLQEGDGSGPPQG